MKIYRCRRCGGEIVRIYDVGGRYIRCNPGLIPYWLDRKGPDEIVTQAGELLRCHLDGRADLITNVGYEPHRNTCKEK